MDTPKVSKMWTDLQKANRLPPSQTLVGAETELQELMRQIDVMVQSRKADWEREKQSLMARLDVREHEYNIQKTNLEHKHQEIGHLRAQLESVEQCQRNASQDYERQLSGLRDEVASMKKEYEKLHRRYSKQIKEKTRGAANSETSAMETKRLQDKLQEYRQRCRDWEQRQRDYERQIEHLSNNKLVQEEKHFVQSRADIEILQDAHRSEIEGMKGEIATVTKQLHGRNITIATLTEKMAAAERQAREHNELIEQKQAAIQVLQAQLNAVRLENQHLRSSAMALGGASNMDIAEVERHLQGLQGAYAKSVSTLEGQNEKLQSHIQALQDQLHGLTSDNHSRLQNTLIETQKSLQDQCQQQTRKISSIQEEHQDRLKSQEERMAAMVSRYEAHISSLQAQLAQMEEQLDNKNQSIRRIGLEHGVMRHFVEGVDRMVQASPRLSRSTESNRDNIHYTANSIEFSVDMDDEIEEDYLTDTVEAATAKFLQEQDERTKELELQLDDHIEKLRHNTEVTVQRLTHSR